MIPKPSPRMFRHAARPYGRRRGSDLLWSTGWSDALAHITVVVPVEDGPDLRMGFAEALLWAEDEQDRRAAEARAARSAMIPASTEAPVPGRTEASSTATDLGSARGQLHRTR